MNIINISNKNKVKKFIFASSSSVYGDKKKFPLKENMDISPKNIYSATKKINEDIANDLSKISNMKMIGLCCLTNYASGISGEELTHSEVVKKARDSQKTFIKMLNALIENLVV